MKRKQIRLAVAIAVAAVLGLAGCASGNSPAASGKPTILIWTDATRQPGLEAYVKSVGDKENIKIQVFDPAQLLNKIQLFNRTKKGWPDLVFDETPTDLGALASSQFGNFAAPLDKVVSKSFLDGYGKANDWCKIDGKTYCLRNDLGQTVLYYNTKIFAQLGLTVPTTMAEWDADAQKLKGTGYVAGAIGDQGIWAGFLQPSGCPVATIVKDDTVEINGKDDKCTRVSDMLQPLIDDKVLDTRSSTDPGFIKNIAQQDKVAMTFGPSWFGDAIIKPASSWAVPNGEIAAAAMPSWPGQKAISGDWGGGIWLVSSHSKFPKAAAAAAEWMTTDPSYVKTAPTYPAQISAAKVWSSTLASDTWWAQDPSAVFAAQAQLLDETAGATRYGYVGEIAGTLSTTVDNGGTLQEGIDAWTKDLTNLAPNYGYAVVTSK